MEKLTCKMYLKDKRRFCKVERYKEEEFCVHHLESEDRIVCPLDKSHKISKSRLDAHIKSCNKSRELSSNKDKFWFKENANDFKLDYKDDQGNSNVLSTKELLKNLSKEDLEKIKISIESIYESLRTKYLAAFEKSSFNKTISMEEINKCFEFDKSVLLKEIPEEERNKNIKSDNQCVLITNVVAKFQFLQEKSIYIEFGAGKGRLAHHIANACDDLKIKEAGFILIEREARRHKFDKNHRDGKNWQRIRCDIKDFDFSKIPKIFSDLQFSIVIGLSKHACGLATDLAIKSTLICPNSAGMVLTTCCHHLSNQSCEYLKKSIECYLNFEERNLFFALSSWALSNFKSEDEPNTISSEILEKRILGLKVKRCIDLARCLHLINNNWEAILYKYCSEELTPENIAIIARLAN